MEEIPSLKYDKEPRLNAVKAYISGGLAATVRYNCEEDIIVSDTISLKTTHGEVFGVGRVVKVVICKVKHALEEVEWADARHCAKDTRDLLGMLNYYYEDEIGRETEVVIFVLDPEIDPHYTVRGKTV